MDRTCKRIEKCFVPNCKNTTKNSRHKLFLYVREQMKRRWCSVANLVYTPGRRLLCCEDHVNLEESLENYQRYKMMGCRPILKLTAELLINNAVPSTSQENQHRRLNLQECQLPDNRSLLTDFPTLKGLLEQSTISPTQKLCISTPTVFDVATQTPFDLGKSDQETSTEDLMKRSNLLQSLLVSPAVSPKSSSPKSSSPGFKSVSSPSLYGFTTDTEVTESQITCSKTLSARQQMLEFIANDPKSYIGVPKTLYALVEHIANESKIKVSKLSLIITLYKIKSNDPVFKICDYFQISKVTFTQYFHTGIKVLADFFQNLIYIPTKLQMKRNLPLSFKIRYSNVTMLLDAFEIEIQKPHRPVSQSGTWSQYKHCNTVKYLIGSTPNGFVSFISKGYGGRISDKALLEKSNLIECLPDNAIIMADRGFKEVEALFNRESFSITPS